MSLEAVVLPEKIMLLLHKVAKQFQKDVSFFPLYCVSDSPTRTLAVPGG